MKQLQLIRVFTLGVCLVAILCGVSTAALALEPGARCPGFVPSDASPAVTQLSDQTKGKVVLIDFWASWCGSCRKALPWLSELQARIGKDQFEVIAVNVDTNVERAEALVRETAAEVSVVYGPKGSVPERFGVQGLPSSYLVDRSGHITAVYVGSGEEEHLEIERSVRALLDSSRS